VSSDHPPPRIQIHIHLTDRQTHTQHAVPSHLQPAILCWPRGQSHCASFRTVVWVQSKQCSRTCVADVASNHDEVSPSATEQPPPHASPALTPRSAISSHRQRTRCCRMTTSDRRMINMGRRDLSNSKGVDSNLGDMASSIVRLNPSLVPTTVDSAVPSNSGNGGNRHCYHMLGAACVWSPLLGTAFA
jgi:hypothetical protein